VLQKSHKIEGWEGGVVVGKWKSGCAWFKVQPLLYWSFVYLVHGIESVQTIILL